MNEIEQLREWAKLVNIPPETVSDQGDLIGFFHFFGPNGKGLESVFEGHLLGQEVMERIKECFSSTSNNRTKAYHIPHPTKSLDNEAISLLKKHFEDLIAIATTMKDQELVDILSAVPIQQVPKKEFDDVPLIDDSPNGWIFDMITDYTSTLTPVETPLLLLRDAVYSIANDKLLQQYILWPIYCNSSPLIDPYHSYFMVWSKGIRYTIPSSDTCLFYS